MSETQTAAAEIHGAYELYCAIMDKAGVDVLERNCQSVGGNILHVALNKACSDATVTVKQGGPTWLYNELCKLGGLEGIEE